MTDRNTFRFFDLPLELRLDIYSCLDIEIPIPTRRPPKAGEKFVIRGSSPNARLISKRFATELDLHAAETKTKTLVLQHLGPLYSAYERALNPMLPQFYHIEICFEVKPASACSAADPTWDGAEIDRLGVRTVLGLMGPWTEFMRNYTRLLPGTETLRVDLVFPAPLGDTHSWPATLREKKHTTLSGREPSSIVIIMTEIPQLKRLRVFKLRPLGPFDDDTSRDLWVTWTPAKGWERPYPRADKPVAVVTAGSASDCAHGL